MRAIEITEYGGPEVLAPGPRPKPTPGAGQVLIEVAAAGINRPDAMQREGLYPPPPGASDIPGLEVSGVIAELGADVTRWSLGDEVCALIPGGGYAEFAVADEGCVLPIPPGVSLQDAAGLPETYCTVWSNVFERGGLQPGETFLVHGAAGGIGVTAIQMARARGARVFATAAADYKREACTALGAEIVVNYREEDFVDVLMDATNGKGVDVILDIIGGDYIDRNLQLAAMNGRIVNLSFIKGAKVEADFMPMLKKHLTMTASTLRPRAVDEKSRIMAALEAQIWPLFGEGKLKPVTDSVFDLDRAAEAHARLDSALHIGKILLEP